MILSDDWGREAKVREHTFLDIDPKGRVRGNIVGLSGDGLLYRFVMRVRLGKKPICDIWDCEDGSTWGRDL